MKVFAFCLLLIIVFEAGLELKFYFKKRSLEAKRIESKNGYVLVIGDSVLGNSNNKKSIYSRLEEKIEKTLPTLSLVEISEKANYSSKANYRVDEAIKEYHPQVAIILLGHSDFIVQNEEKETYSIGLINKFKEIVAKTQLFKLYVSLNYNFHMSKENASILYENKIENFRKIVESPEEYKKQEMLYQSYLSGKLDCKGIFDLIYMRSRYYQEKNQDITEKALKCLENQKRNLQAYLALGRAFRNVGDIDKAKVYFNEALKLAPKSEVAIDNLFGLASQQANCPDMFMYVNMMKIIRRPVVWGLRNCFLSEDKLADGIEYFKKLAIRFPQSADLSLMISQTLEKGKINELLNGYRTAGNRDSYLSQLYYYRLNSMPEKANDLYKRKNDFISRNQNGIDFKSYRAIISKLLKKNVKVIVLQYPNHPDWMLLEVVAPFSDQIQFISLSSYFNKHLSKHSVFDFFQNDFIHVSDLGAELIASELSQVVLNYYRGSDEQKK